MEQSLRLQVMILALVAVGFLVRRLGLVSEAGQKSLTRLVTDLILPCNIFRAFLQADGPAALRQGSRVLAVALGIQIFCVLWGRLIFRRVSDDRSRSLRFGVICSNAGFLGNPIAEGLYGAQGLILANIYLIPQRIMMWSSGLAIYTGSHDRKKTLKMVLTHPCIIACALGLVFMLLGWKLPEVIMGPISAISSCNTAMSMMAVGMIMARLNPKELADPLVLRFTLHRLILIPAIIWGVCLLLPLDAMSRNLCVLLAAMPAGATTSILADRYNRDPAFASRLVIFSTLVSVPTLAMWIYILNRWG